VAPASDGGREMDEVGVVHPETVHAKTAHPRLAHASYRR
jgi:hypothetical protein